MNTYFKKQSVFSSFLKLGLISLCALNVISCGGGGGGDAKEGPKKTFANEGDDQDNNKKPKNEPTLVKANMVNDITNQSSIANKRIGSYTLKYNCLEKSCLTVNIVRQVESDNFEYYRYDYIKNGMLTFPDYSSQISRLNESFSQTSAFENLFYIFNDADFKNSDNTLLPNYSNFHTYNISDNIIFNEMVKKHILMSEQNHINLAGLSFEMKKNYKLNDYKINKEYFTDIAKYQVINGINFLQNLKINISLSNKNSDQSEIFQNAILEVKNAFSNHKNISINTYNYLVNLGTDLQINIATKGGDASNKYTIPLHSYMREEAGQCNLSNVAFCADFIEDLYKKMIDEFKLFDHDGNSPSSYDSHYTIESFTTEDMNTH